MPKKDIAAAVIDMLSSAGAQTRRITEDAELAVETVAPPAVTVTQHAAASVSALSTSTRAVATTGEAPRTLRLRPATAERLRRAWMEAKRDDVFLTAQDFASDLLDEALARGLRLPAAQN